MVTLAETQLIRYTILFYDLYTKAKLHVLWTYCISSHITLELACYSSKKETVSLCDFAFIQQFNRQGVNTE